MRKQISFCCGRRPHALARRTQPKPQTVISQEKDCPLRAARLSILISVWGCCGVQALFAADLTKTPSQRAAHKYVFYLCIVYNESVHSDLFSLLGRASCARSVGSANRISRIPPKRNVITALCALQVSPLRFVLLSWQAGGNMCAQ